jgi:hypothetical protein
LDNRAACSASGDGAMETASGGCVIGLNAPVTHQFRALPRRRISPWGAHAQGGAVGSRPSGCAAFKFAAFARTRMLVRMP